MTKETKFFTFKAMLTIPADTMKDATNKIFDVCFENNIAVSLMEGKEVEDDEN